ncbi:MAG: biotin transporter BioY [Candidatus Fimenecus sp.]
MKRKKLVFDIAVSGLFCTLICVGAFIKIPIPNLPITMQVFFVLLAGLVLEPKTAFFASFAYMFLGLVGLPIFTGGGGIGYVFIPSFGFIIGFVIAASVMSLILHKAKKQPLWLLSLVALAGIIIIYLVGIPYFALITNGYKGGDKSAIWFIQALLVPFIPKEIISTVAAILVSYKLRPLLAKIK